MIKKGWLLEVFLLMNLILSTLFPFSTNIKQLILSLDLCYCQLKQGLAQEFLKINNTMSCGVSLHCATFLIQ